MSKNRWQTGKRLLLLVIALLAFLAYATPTPQETTYRGSSGSTMPESVPPKSSPPLTLPFPLPNLFPSLNPINPEQIIRDTLVTPSENIFQQIADWFNRENSILVQTDATATYGNDAVMLVWHTILIIVNATLVLVLLFAGYELLFSNITLRYTTALGLLPRILLAFAGANLSLIFAYFCIELNNVLCRILLALLNNHPIQINLQVLMPSGLSFPMVILVLILCVMTVFLAFEVLARQGLLIVEIVFLSLFFALLASTRTRHLGGIGIRAFLATVFLQFLQLTVITAGTLMFAPFLAGHVLPGRGMLVPITTILTCMATFWAALQLPGLLRVWMLGPIADSGRPLSYVLTFGLTQFLRR